ncbi:MAG: hypothetical protein NXI07_04240 [bacterium]|nr:hypothetical protein [bacterium]
MGGDTQRILVRAYAKVNLALAVGAPVDQPGTPTHGYHPICSYMHAIDLHDTIEIQRAPDAAYDIAWKGVDGIENPVEWETERDLAVRAHLAVQARVGEALPCVLRVRKAIPAGGGLGGGSSDAAAVLRGLDQLFNLALGEETLRSIAMTLGSDIAFFLDDAHTPPRPGIVSGFGERIERVDARHAGREISLLLPGFGCATGAVYGAFDARCGGDAVREEAVRALAGVTELGDELIFNDLRDAAFTSEPRLRELCEHLSGSLGGGVHMSGSGSTLFVLGRCDERLVHDLAPECRVVHTRLC